MNGSNDARRRGLKVVDPPQPSLGESMAALAATDFDALDLILRPHLSSERTRSQMELARRIIFGDDMAES